MLADKARVLVTIYCWHGYLYRQIGTRYVMRAILFSQDFLVPILGYVNLEAKISLLFLHATPRGNEPKTILSTAQRARHLTTATPRSKEQ